MKKLLKMFSLMFVVVFCCCGNIFAYGTRYISPSNYSSRQQFEQALKNEFQFALNKVDELSVREQRGMKVISRMQHPSTIRNIMKRCLEECCILEINEPAPPDHVWYGCPPYEIEYRVGKNCVASWGW